MLSIDVTVEVAVTKLEARILFEPNDDFSLRIRNVLRIALREEPDDRHSQTAPLLLTKRQCYPNPEQHSRQFQQRGVALPGG